MNKDLKLGIVFLLFSGFLWFYAIPFQIKGSTQALYPRCLTLALLVPCALFFIKGIKAKREGIRPEPFGLFSLPSLKALILVPLMFAYVFTIDLIGFYVTTFIFINIFLLFFGVRKVLPLIIFSVLIPVVIHLVIYELLSFPFPEGILF